MLLVRLLQVCTDPLLKISASLGPRVLLLRLDGVQGSEANAEGHLLNVYFGRKVILVSHIRRELKELEKCVAGEAPSLGVPGGKGLRVGQCFGKGKNGSLAVQGPGKLLCVLENDVEVYRGEQATD